MGAPGLISNAVIRQTDGAYGQGHSGRQSGREEEGEG